MLISGHLVRTGECLRCGMCCDVSRSQPAIWASLTPTANPDVRLLQGKPIPRVCADLLHLINGKTGCAIYERRPPPCREFPTTPDDLKLLPECGFKFVWRPDNNVKASVETDSVEYGEDDRPRAQGDEGRRGPR